MQEFNLTLDELNELRVDNGMKTVTEIPTERKD